MYNLMVISNRCPFVCRRRRRDGSLSFTWIFFFFFLAKDACRSSPTHSQPHEAEQHEINTECQRYQRGSQSQQLLSHMHSHALFKPEHIDGRHSYGSRHARLKHTATRQPTSIAHSPEPTSNWTTTCKSLHGDDRMHPKGVSHELRMNLRSRIGLTGGQSMLP